jgi:cation diffusion facilitator family transporter
MNNSEHSAIHSHNFTLETNTQEKRVRAVFWLTTITMVAEIAAGTWFGSMALLADGWHMGTHSAAFAIALFAYYYARRHANNPRFSFGTGKVIYLGGFASAVALAVVAVLMAIESILRLIEPQQILFNQAIVVACLGLAVNIISVFVLHGADHHHHDHDHDHQHGHGEDHTLKAAYLHVIADALTSLTAIVALVTGKYLGWIWMDALMGIVGALVISRWAYGLLKQTSKPLLDENPHLAEKQSIEEYLQQQERASILDYHVWQVSPHHRAAIIAIASENPQQPEDYRQRLNAAGFYYAHLTVEVSQR